MAICTPAAFTAACPLGFYCPNSTPDHPPHICIPSRECALKRLHGIVCEPQGWLEPRVCNAGFYCPRGGKKEITCPPGWHCPVGSFKPVKCGFGSHCPAGAKVSIQPLPLYFTIAFDIILFGVMGCCLYRRHKYSTTREKREQKGQNVVTAEQAKSVKEAKKEKKEEDIGALSRSMDGGSDEPRPMRIAVIDTVSRRGRTPGRAVATPPPDQNEAAVVRFIRRARIESGLDFGFETVDIPNGRIPRGKIVGVIGPGKAEFIRALAGQQKPAKTSQDGIVVRINGHLIDPSSYREVISLVPRENIAIPHLTVRENILRAARMRLPPTFTRHDVHEFADALIAAFNLTDVEHSCVGSSKSSALSEAQRKLVDIAMALAAGPTAIFMDEPSADMNLDDSARLFRLLKLVSKQGVTIAITMNQPTRDIWENIHLGPQGQHTPGAYHCAPSLPAKVQELINLRRAADDRGIPWFAQLGMHWRDATAQESREPLSLASELGVSSLAGLLVGISIRAPEGTLFRGVFLPPFETLSVGIDYRGAPTMGLIGSLAIGAVASTSGVRIFAQERSMTEFQSGQSRSAYYIGETLATIHRLCLTSLHFTALVCTVGAPHLRFWDMYVANLMYFWGAYGQADILKLALGTGRWAATLSFSLIIVGGFFPLLLFKEWNLKWLWRISPAAWYTEAYAGLLVSPLGYLYDLTLAGVAMGLNFNAYHRSIVAMFVIGLVYRVLVWAVQRH